MHILTLILLAFGMTKIVNSGSLFDSFKKWLNDYNDAPPETAGPIVKFLNCPLCVGFWVGVLIGLCYGPFPWWNILFNGSFYSGCAWLLSCLSQYLGNGFDPTRSLIVNVDSPIELKNHINNSGRHVLKG
jgi:hypothetical protein